MTRRMHVGIFALVLTMPSVTLATTYHVAQEHPLASDENPGTAQQPWKTISKAAAELLPGDEAVIHRGVCGEWVKPARSGLAAEPIVCEAACWRGRERRALPMRPRSLSRFADAAGVVQATEGK